MVRNTRAVRTAVAVAGLAAVIGVGLPSGPATPVSRHIPLPPGHGGSRLPGHEPSASAAGVTWAFLRR